MISALASRFQNACRYRIDRGDAFIGVLYGSGYTVMCTGPEVHYTQYKIQYLQKTKHGDRYMTEITTDEERVRKLRYLPEFEIKEKTEVVYKPPKSLVAKLRKEIKRLRKEGRIFYLIERDGKTTVIEEGEEELCLMFAFT